MKVDGRDRSTICCFREHLDVASFSGSTSGLPQHRPRSQLEGVVSLDPTLMSWTLETPAFFDQAVSLWPDFEACRYTHLGFPDYFYIMTQQ